jgi:hypothetical protein
MKTKIITLAAAMLLATCAYAQVADEKVLRLPHTEPIFDGYVKDINARMSGAWVIVPFESETGSVQAERFDLVIYSMNERTGHIRFQSEQSAYPYWCNVTMPTGSAVDCIGAFGGYNFAGESDGAYRFVGWIGGRGARVPAIMVRVQ